MFFPDWELVNGKLSAKPNTTLMQFTGLRDKHGIDIYEGDIIEFLDFSGGSIFSTQPKTICEIKWGKAGYNLPGYGFIFAGNDCKVVGNIHENPELLEN